MPSWTPRCGRVQRAIDPQGGLKLFLGTPDGDQPERVQRAIDPQGGLKPAAPDPERHPGAEFKGPLIRKAD